MNQLKAISVVDGRYASKTKLFQNIFSEYGLIKHRVIVEIEWLKFILKELQLETITDLEINKINKIKDDFNLDSAVKVKEIENITNHDVKAVEYFIKEQLENNNLLKFKEWVHFALTSEDINNTAYALMLKEGSFIIMDLLRNFLNKLEELAKKYKKTPMMSKTHGQPASPTTVGKEFINFAWRIKKELTNLSKIDVEAKLNGATGNYNAHSFVFPHINWINASQKFISEYLKLKPIFFTTQINPNSYISEIMHSLIRISAIMIDLDRDMWGYISFGYFKQKTKKGEVGSSTMPHKVNPIDFENSEGNLGMAISLMEHLSVKLLNSRFQRDLSDSTVLRNLGLVFSYLVISINSSLKGLNKLELNEEIINSDLENNYELLAEPFQMIMRVYKEDSPYEKLKELTRGKKVSKNDLIKFIDKLENIPSEVKNKMKALNPKHYIGKASELVDIYFKFFND